MNRGVNYPKRIMSSSSTRSRARLGLRKTQTGRCGLETSVGIRWVPSVVLPEKSPKSPGETSSVQGRRSRRRLRCLDGSRSCDLDQPTRLMVLALMSNLHFEQI